MEQIYEYIYAIYQTGSFKNAAEKLHITQPALSIALKKYEDQLGSPVFDRKRHPFVLTPAGEIILRSVERMSLDERRMRIELSDLMDMSYGEITIGATHYANTCILPSILASYMERYPKIRIRITEKSSSEIAKGFSDDVYDVAVCASKLNADNVMRIPVFQDSLYWVIPNRFLEPGQMGSNELPHFSSENGDAVPRLPTLSLLQEIPIIALMPGDNLYEQAAALFSAEKIAPQVRMNVPQSTTAWHMACAGIGAALIPARMMQIIPPDEADVSIFSFDSPLMQRTICAFCKTDQYISTATRKFLSLCRSAVKTP